MKRQLDKGQLLVSETQNKKYINNKIKGESTKANDLGHILFKCMGLRLKLSKS